MDDIRPGRVGGMCSARGWDACICLLGFRVDWRGSGSGLGGVDAVPGATVLTLAEGEDSGIGEGVVLVSGDGVVEAVGKGDPMESPGVRARHDRADWRTVDLAGKFILPGFVSGHSHLWQSAFRGLAPAGELHPWLRALHWTYGAGFADGDVAAFTLHGAYDQLRHGVTTTYNHSHWLGKGFARYREQWEAEMTTTQRFVFARVNERDESVEPWRERLSQVLAELKPAPQTGFLGLVFGVFLGQSVGQGGVIPWPTDPS